MVDYKKHKVSIDGPREAMCLSRLERLAFRLSVCLSQDDGHTPLLTVMQFWIKVLGIKVERRTCKNFISPVSNGGCFIRIFHSYGLTPWTISVKFDFIRYIYWPSLLWLKRWAVRLCGYVSISRFISRLRPKALTDCHDFLHEVIYTTPKRFWMEPDRGTLCDWRVVLVS